jgi:hypothetical protein
MPPFLQCKSGLIRGVASLKGDNLVVRVFTIKVHLKSHMYEYAHALSMIHHQIVEQIW